MQLPLCLLLSVVCGVEYSQLAAEDPPSEEEALLKRADLGGVGRDSFSASSESSDEAAAAAMADGERGHQLCVLFILILRKSFKFFRSWMELNIQCPSNKDGSQ